MSWVFFLVASAAVLAGYTAIGRFATPSEERVPLRSLGFTGWLHTLRRSVVFLSESAPKDASARAPRKRGSRGISLVA